MAIDTFDDLMPKGHNAVSSSPLSPVTSSDNSFSDLMPKEPNSSNIIRRGIGDPLVGLARGAAVGIPETAVGLLDIPTFGGAGKVAESIGKGLGIGGFGEGRKFFNKMLSPETQEAQRKVSGAEGFVDTIKTAVQNPSAIVQVVAESIPAMLTGTRLIGMGQKALGYGAKELAGLTGKELLAATASNKAKQIVTGALGEASVTAGQNIEQVRQETEDKLLTPMQVGINVASAAVTGIIGVLGGKLANRLGVEDFNTLMAGGIAGKDKKGLLKSLLYGAFQEGAVEELPQSMQEQIAQNISLGKPIDDQIFEQGAIGLLAGIAQSTGAQVAGGMMQQLRAKDVNQQDIDLQITQLPTEVQEAIGGMDGNVTGSQINVEKLVAPEVEKANEIIKQEERQGAEAIPDAQPAPATPAVSAIPAAIPDAIRAEVSAMSPANLARTAAEDREPIVRQAAAEEIQRRNELPEKERVAIEKPAPVTSTPEIRNESIESILSEKSNTELAKLASENKGEPIGVAAGKLFDQRMEEKSVEYKKQASEKGIGFNGMQKFPKRDSMPMFTADIDGVQTTFVLEKDETLDQAIDRKYAQKVRNDELEKERQGLASATAPMPNVKKIDYDAMAREKGILLDAFKKQTDINQLNVWAEEGVVGAQIELDRRLQEGSIQPSQITWKAKEKSKEDVASRIKKIADYHEKYLNLNKSTEEKLKARKSINLQLAAIRRKIDENPTDKEFTNARKYLSSIYTGRSVNVDGEPAVATGKTSFGKYQIRKADGTEVFLPLSKIATKNITKKDVYNYLKSEGMKNLEQAESILTAAKKEGEEENEPKKQQATSSEGEIKERASILSEIQNRDNRRVRVLRQVILANSQSPVGIREAAKKDGGIAVDASGYENAEFIKAAKASNQYGMELIPITESSNSINACVSGRYIYVNMSRKAADDVRLMDSVYHELSHVKGNKETQDKIDTNSDAFLLYQKVYSKHFTGNYESLVSTDHILGEMAADLEAGIPKQFSVNYADALKPGMSVASLRNPDQKIEATKKLEYSIRNYSADKETNNVQYSLRDKKIAIIPEWLNSTISASLSTFASNPQNLPKAEVKKIATELKSNKDFSKIEYALSVPSRMAQKHPLTWGKLYRIFAVDREEVRDELRHEFQRKAEPFLMYDRKMHDQKMSKDDIAASMDRIQRTIIAGDAIAVEFTDEQLTEGINDKYGKEVKLSKDEIAAYRSVRDTLRHIRTVLVNHLANQSLRGYRRNKWFRVLEAAMKGDSLNVETIQELLDKKGMKQAALDRAKKLQPNITKIFDRIENGIDKIPTKEVARAGKYYEKIANSLQAELTELQGYVSELTGIADKTELAKMTREIFSAYMQTRPQMKIIRNLRNEVGMLDGYFPRFRESGDKKFRVYEQELDSNGNIAIDEETGKEIRREVYMGMFSNNRQGNEVIKDAMKKLNIKQSDITADGKFPTKYFVEITRQNASPESAYQGVNDINLQRLFDDAMRAAQEKGVHGMETKYTDANGNEINVFEQIRQAGLQSLTNHLKARGAMQRSIKRSEDLIEGYQENNLQRVLLDYITSMSGLMTKQVAASEAMELLSTIKDPFLFSSMSRYTREMLRNNSLSDRISGYTRAAAFTYFLGGLLKSAVVNLTQNPIVGFAELGKFIRDNKIAGLSKSDIIYATAMKDVLSGNLSNDEKVFIDKMVNRGIATNQFIQSVFDNVMNKGLRRHIAVMNFLAKPFSMSEVYNRKSAAVAMYRVAYNMRLSEAKERGMSEDDAKTEAERMTFDDARDFITNVHYAYGKTNRPLPIMTGDALGAAAASMYTFKGFSHNFLARQAELLSKGDFKTLGHTLAYLVLFGGLSTFPFLRDLFDWWEKQYGYNPMNQIRTSLRGIGGETLEKFGVSGLPSVLGANFSGSLSIGLPWPIGASSPGDSIFGVWAGVATKIGRSAQALSHGDLNRGITEISPEFFRAPRVALRESDIGKKILGTPGYATNIRGHAILGEDGKPISMSAWEAALKTMGFNPTDYARAKEKTQNVVRQTAWVNDLKQNVAERYRAARLNNDPNATKDMMANVREVNKKIRSRNLQRLVTPLKVSNVIKSASIKIGTRQRREMMYKRTEL